MTEGDADTADPDDMAIDPLLAADAYYRVGTTRRSGGKRTKIGRFSRLAGG